MLACEVSPTKFRAIPEAHVEIIGPIDEGGVSGTIGYPNLQLTPSPLFEPKWDLSGLPELAQNPQNAPFRWEAKYHSYGNPAGETWSFVKPAMFNPDAARKTLLLSWDTEYYAKDPDAATPDITKRFNVPLCYSYCLTDLTTVWKGVFVSDEKPTLQTFMSNVLCRHLKPRMINDHEVYLVGHYNKADWQMFFNARDRNFLRNVLVMDNKTIVLHNNHLVTLPNNPIKLKFRDRHRHTREVKLHFRDTMCFCPEKKGSLEAVGETVGYPKLDVSKEVKSRMDWFRKTYPEHFLHYAMRDAEITLQYFVKIMGVLSELGVTAVPMTISQGSMLAYIAHCNRIGLDHQRIRGKVRGQGIQLENHPWLEMQRPRLSECFRGGLNECYIVGEFPYDPDYSFIDIDLKSAYALALSMQYEPDWDFNDLRNRRATELFDAGGDYTSYGFYSVDFEYPEEEKFPGIGIKRDNCLIFPQQSSPNRPVYLSLPAILTARERWKDKFTCRLNEGVFLPPKLDEAGNRVYPYKLYLQDLLRRRNATDDSFMKQVLKLLGNGAYGKVCQGVSRQLVSNFQGHSSIIDECDMTCPLHAAMVTEIIRCALNDLCYFADCWGADVCWAITDGLLLRVPVPYEKWFEEDGTQKRLQEVLPGLYDFFKESIVLKELKAVATEMGLEDFLEIKHVTKGAIGFKTRMYGLYNDKNGPWVYEARGGYHTGMDEIIEINDSPNKEKISFTRLTGLYDYLSGKYDGIVEITEEISCNTDYDYKRELLPSNTSRAFTKPWVNEAAFEARRAVVKQLRKTGRATPIRIAESIAGVRLRGGRTQTLLRQIARACHLPGSAWNISPRTPLISGYTHNGIVLYIHYNGSTLTVDQSREAKKYSRVLNIYPAPFSELEGIVKACGRRLGFDVDDPVVYKSLINAFLINPIP